jgi:hypothetical protein
MQDVEERVLLELKKLKEPVSGGPPALPRGKHRCKEFWVKGVIHMVIVSRNPYSASMVFVGRGGQVYCFEV